MAREDIYNMARALSRDTSPSSKRLSNYPPYQQYISFKHYIIVALKLILYNKI